MEQGTSKKVVCENLDKVLIQFFDVLTELYTEQAKLEQYMKSGFLNLSRARYNMGAKSVGIDQCDEAKMAALFKVEMEDCDGGEKFALRSVVGEMKNNTEMNEKSGLRKRNIQSVSVKEPVIETLGSQSETKKGNESVVDKSDLNNETVLSPMPYDPLKWFGVLVPQPLRQGQKDFKETVSISVIVANLKRELACLQSQYRELMKEKMKMVETEMNED